MGYYNLSFFKKEIPDRKGISSFAGVLHQNPGLPAVCLYFLLIPVDYASYRKIPGEVSPRGLVIDMFPVCV